VIVGVKIGVDVKIGEADVVGKEDRVGEAEGLFPCRLNPPVAKYAKTAANKTMITTNNDMIMILRLPPAPEDGAGK